MSFAGLRVASHLAQRLVQMRIMSPTPVQEATLRALMPSAPSQVQKSLVRRDANPKPSGPESGESPPPQAAKGWAFESLW